MQCVCAAPQRRGTGPGRAGKAARLRYERERERMQVGWFRGWFLDGVVDSMTLRIHDTRVLQTQCKPESVGGVVC